MYFVYRRLMMIMMISIHVYVPKSFEQSLLLIHAISRHGDRAPVDTYPTDPFINETFAPYGWGQLTKTGMVHQYELGKFMRKKYHKFLGNLYTPNAISVQSTDSDRTKMSAQLQMAGLFPPRKDQIWNKNLTWQPVVINYEPLNDDKLLLVRIPCPRYHELKDEAQKIEIDENDFSLYHYLSEKTKMNVTSLDDVQSLYSTLKAEEEFGLKLPQWTTEVYPTRMYERSVKSFILNAYSQEMQKLKSGFLLNKIIDDYHKNINQLDNRRIFVYVGHDSTIANFLMALEVWENQVPDYNALILLELHRLNEKFKVKITFKNNTGLYNLKLPNCNVYCSLQKFVDLTRNVTVKNLQEECFNTTWRLKLRDIGSP